MHLSLQSGTFSLNHAQRRSNLAGHSFSKTFFTQLFLIPRRHLVQFFQTILWSSRDGSSHVLDLRLDPCPDPDGIPVSYGDRRLQRHEQADILVSWLLLWAFL